MKTITICGSMKFQDEMTKIAWKLETEKGFCVFQPILAIEGEELTAEGCENIKAAHFQKIDLSDAIYVVNVGGYIGSSTRGEIEYARAHGKEVIFHENV